MNRPPLSLRSRERREALRYGSHSAASTPRSRAIRLAYGPAERKPLRGHVARHALDEAAFMRDLDTMVDSELDRLTEGRAYWGDDL